MQTCLTNISRLLNPREDGTWEEIESAALLFDDRIIAWGDQTEILDKAHKAQAQILDVGHRVVTPGLVDSHTHPAFAEPRAAEYELRCQGRTYQEISSLGGGIRSSVRSLRAISEDVLVERMLPRLNRFLEYGTTTIEAKSGYGLSTADELKQLRAIKRCGEAHSLELIPTLLAAHEVPDEFRSDPSGRGKARYLDVVINETIPAAAESKLAKFCDVFCEEGMFSVEESRRVLEAGKQHGLAPKLHADQLSDTGGAILAAEVGAASADHLDNASDAGIEKMARAGVVFNLLPGAVLFLGLNRYPNARRILNLGGSLALSTDFNPGSSPTQNLPLMMTLAGSFCKLSPRETLWAATRGGARALRVEDRLGHLTPGAQADLVVWDCQDERLIPYHYGMNQVWQVFKSGRQVVAGGKVQHTDL
jgi:imidazolonepropionase